MFEDQGSLYTNFNLPLIAPTIQLKRKPELKNNSGRWKEHEHKKFLEAVILYGNDWKCVHKYIKSRSSTQARSHAQKFLLKLRKKLKIIPSFDPISQCMKLSNEAIHKIIREIVDSSSMRGQQIDKEKLVKLIMGFANLLIGKSKITETTQTSQVMNSSFSSDKTFLIEKVKKRNDCFIIEKTKKEQTQPEIKTNNIQITSQSDLWKLLLSQQQQTQEVNPNKNVINIISINFSNKNGETVPNLNALLNNNQLAQGNVNTNLKPASLKLNTDFASKMDQTSDSRQNSLTNTSSTVESPERVSFFDDFYEEDSSASFGFNPHHNEMDEVDKFFNW